MRACIYARTSRRERQHHGASIDRQVAECRELARQHNLIVENRHVFTDADHEGSWPPPCWAAEGDPGLRPALGAMVQSIEEGVVARVLVYRATCLGTTSNLLTSIAEMLHEHDAHVVMSLEAAESPEDAGERFAVSVLQPRLICDTTADRERKDKLKARKLEELSRLHAKIARIESELAEL